MYPSAHKVETCCSIIIIIFHLTNFRWTLIHTVERQLISEHLGSILCKGLENLLDNNRIHDLTLMYSLFFRVKNGLIDLCSHFNSYIKVCEFYLYNNSFSIFLLSCPEIFTTDIILYLLRRRRAEQ